MGPLHPGKEIFEFGEFQLDAEDRSLRHRDQKVHLPPLAADVLLLLVRNQGRVVNRAALKALWGLPVVDDRNLNFQILVVRRALAVGFEGEVIETVRKLGFRFLPPVSVRYRETSPATPAPAAMNQFPEADAEPPPPAVTALPASITTTDGQHELRTRTRRWRRAAAAALTVLAAAVTIGVFRSDPEPHLEVASTAALTNDGVAKNTSLLFVDHGHAHYVGSTDVTSNYSASLAGGPPSEAIEQPHQFKLVDARGSDHLYLALRNGPEQDKEVWTFDGTPGSPRRMANLRCNSAAWSPSGDEIACVANGRLLVAADDGRILRWLTSPLPGDPVTPRWSPNGARLRFTIVTPADWVRARSALWEVRSDGSDLRPLFEDDPAAPSRCCGDWTPDGRHFIFESGEDGESELWALTESASWLGRTTRALTRLTHDGMSFHSPRVGPDGKTIFAIGRDPRGELVRLDQDTGRFELYLPGISGTWLAFSPDTKWIAYVGHPDRRLWRARADGSDPRQLTDGELTADGLTLSPDGKWIAVMSPRSGKPSIFLLPSEGGPPFPITSVGRAQGIPSWSPTSKHLVFGEVPKEFGNPDGTEVLYEYDLDSKRLSAIPGSTGLWTPRWSPDVRYVAALTIVGQSLRVLDRDRNQWRALPVDNIGNPSWSADGRYIYFDTTGSSYSLKRIRVADDAVEEVASLQHLPVAAHYWSGLAPDDAPILLRSRGGTEIYALALRYR
jgi:Tol biopolymer transport system component/DNA-binding winged helix-turn-helix (wHTH) protein